jgi:hypothetical protein
LENSKAGETYVDVVFDLTNAGTVDVRCDKLFTLTATNAAGTAFACKTFAAETNGGSYLSQYSSIAPLATSSVHCAISVPEAETSLTLTMEMNGQKYTYDYTMGTTISNAKAVQVGGTLEATDFATVVFKGIEYTDDLLPSNTSGYYRHYPISNASNSYLVAKFDFTNYSATAKDCDEFMGLKATYMDKYTYSGFVVVEEEDGKGFSSYEGIAPLTTRQAFYLIEVPKTVMTNDVTLTIIFNNQEYTYTGK